jgi:hypothetical protein
MIRRLFFGLIGFALLVAGAVTLWVARGPQAKESLTTGGVVYSQQEIMQSGGELTAVVDAQAGVEFVQVPVEPNITGAVSVDLSTMSQAEIAAAPNTIMTEGIAPTIPLTTDIVLDAGTQVEVAPLTTTGGPTPDGQGGLSPTAQGYEQRVVELEWPGDFQVGRSGAVRITLKMLESGALQPVAEVADNEVLATPILITDRYDTHNAFVTAALSAPDFKIESTSPVTQPMQRGSEVEWRWTLESSEAQTAVISLGLTITWEPKPGQPPGPVNVPIWGQTVQVEVQYVFGLITVPQASIVGTALAVLGFVGQVPLLGKFLELWLDALFDRSRRRREEEEERRRRSSRRR